MYYMYKIHVYYMYSRYTPVLRLHINTHVGYTPVLRLHINTHVGYTPVLHV